MRLRSVLFTPGTRPERIQKALRSHAADIVVADLEDAVAPGDKIEARLAVRNALLDTPSAPAVRAIRINAWPSRLAEDDLQVILAAKPDLLVVPKAESVDAIRALDARLAEGPGSDASLLLILETARGVLHAEALASASSRVVAVAFGAEDLAADAGMSRSPDNWEMAVPRSLVALGAHAAGVQAIDMICADYSDLERAKREAAEAKALGYAGKMCIHPAQVAPVHEAFAPTMDELSWAKSIVAAADEAGAGSGGVVVVDGAMVDVPVIEQARRILREAL